MAVLIGQHCMRVLTPAAALPFLGDTADVRAFANRLTGPGAVRPWTIAALVAVYVNIVSGALVRVTNSGLGCPDWPLCNGRPTPPFQFHGLIEFTNRVLAFAVIVIAVLLAVTAYRSLRSASRWQIGRAHV